LSTFIGVCGPDTGNALYSGARQRNACVVMTDQPSDRGVVPPPLIYLVCLLVGLGLDYLWPAPVLSPAVQYGAGGVLIVASVLLFGLTLREFSRANTSINHRRPTTSVITTGPFGLTRNPVYGAMTMLFVGIASVIDGLWILAMVIPAVLIVHFFVILKEEAFLEREFGDTYRRYKNSVRRWF
jgi:protein-S-isoprenylcysteine O-methyltransferase Ste14